MHSENLLTSFDIRRTDHHLTVKTPWSQQSRIQNFRPVCSGNNDNAEVHRKTIHLHQQLIQRLVPLITGSTAA